METPTPIKPDYFFDTTVLIAYFRDEDPYTAEVIEPVLRGEKIGAVSVVSVAEICAASDMDLPELRDKRLAVLRELRVVPIDSAIAERGGELRRVHHLELPDALIAACAEHAGGQFLTKDPHFERLLKAKMLSGQIYE